RLERSVRQEHFEGEFLARLVGHLAVLDLPAGGLQERDGLAQLLAEVARAVALGRIELGGEDLVGDLSLERLEDLELLGRGQALGLELAIAEVGARTGVESVAQ